MAADPMVDLRRRFTVEEYELMGRTGILHEDDRTELLDGEIVMMSPIGPRHSATTSRVNRAMVLAVQDRAIVRIQDALRLLPRSEPQPDIIVARPRRDFYEGGHPTAEDTLLVIEVADSSLHTDHAIKIPIYARENILEVWTVDLTEKVVRVYTEPVAGTYLTMRTLRLGDVLVPTAIKDVKLPVAAILGKDLPS
jgi:Uma2 family endonuclease